MANKVMVVVMDGQGQIGASQPYIDFSSGRQRNLQILSCLTGRRLFDIMYDDLGIIRYEDNKLVLKMIFQQNPTKTTMSLLGKIAEAVIVRRCNEDAESKQKWLAVARRKKTRKQTVEKFRAIGTGLKSTLASHPQLYNPGDTQRDIIFVDQQDMRAMIKTSSVSGLEAGLQIKVSRNGNGYLLEDLCKSRYEVPVVYFDICHDFEAVAREVLLRKNNVIIEDNFVRASGIDYEAYEEVCFYEDLVMALVTGKLTIEALLSHQEVTSNTTLQNAILSTALEQIQINSIIV